MSRCRPVVPLVLMALACTCPAPVRAAPPAVFQYAVPVKDVSGKDITAFLWVPPAAERVRGVLVGGLTLMEQELAIPAKARAARDGVILPRLAGFRNGLHLRAQRIVANQDGRELGGNSGSRWPGDFSRGAPCKARALTSNNPFVGPVNHGERNVSILNLRQVAQALRVPLAELLAEPKEQWVCGG